MRFWQGTNQNFLSMQLGFLLLIASSSDALAQGSVPSNWKGTRPAAMGGALTSVGNDENAPYTNPAGLGRSRNPRSRKNLHLISFPGLVVGGNAQVVSAVKDGMLKPGDRFARFVDSARNKPDLESFAEAQLYPVVTFGGKSSPTYLIGFPARTENSFLFSSTSEDPTGMTAQVRSLTDMGMALGIASTSKAATFAYGISVRPIYRYSYENSQLQTESLSQKSFAEEVKTNANKVFGVGVDAGFIYTAADFWLPSIGVAVRNIPTGCKENYIHPISGKTLTVCGALFSGSVKNQDDNALLDPMELRVGYSITPRIKTFGPTTNLRIAADAFPIPITTGGKSYGLSDMGISKLVHVGAELFFGNAMISHPFGIRAGLADDLPTFGGSFEILGLMLEYATYAIYRTGTTKVDRRHLIGISTRW